MRVNFKHTLAVMGQHIESLVLRLSEFVTQTVNEMLESIRGVVTASARTARMKDGQDSRSASGTGAGRKRRPTPPDGYAIAQNLSPGQVPILK